MTRLPRALASVLFFVFVTTIAASADSVVLTFEGLGPNRFVGNYYLGRYGITFSANTFTNTTVGNSFVPPPGPGDTVVGMNDDLTVPSSLIIDATNGFKSSFSFDYIAGIAGSLSLYSGPNGTGSLLAMIGLPLTPMCSSGPLYCQWLHVNLDFRGTAQSAVFVDMHDYLALDNIQLNLIGTGHTVTPEPTSLLLVGTGLAGILTRGRKFIRRH